MINIKEEFVGGPKFLRARELGGDSAIVLWLCLKAYAAANPTDGFIPDEDLDALPGLPKRHRKLIRALLECGRLGPDGIRGAGLVERTEFGWQLHDYLDHAMSAIELESRKENERTRKALFRAKTFTGPSVYVMRRASDGAYKIGFSENPVDRRRTVQSEEHCAVELIGHVRGSLRDEGLLHARFGKYRIGKSEWFHPEPEILSILQRPRGQPQPQFQFNPEDNPEAELGVVPRGDPARAGAPARARARPSQPSPAQPIRSDPESGTSSAEDLTGSARADGPAEEGGPPKRDSLRRKPKASPLTHADFLQLEIDNPGLSRAFAEAAATDWLSEPDARQEMFGRQWRIVALKVVRSAWRNERRRRELLAKIGASPPPLDAAGLIAEAEALEAQGL